MTWNLTSFYPVRWVSGTPALGESSAYPVWFGKAVFFIHSRVLKEKDYRKRNALMEEFAREMIQERFEEPVNQLTFMNRRYVRLRCQFIIVSILSQLLT